MTNPKERRDYRSDAEVFSDMIESLRTARCKYTLTAERNPHVRLGEDVIRTERVQLQCQLRLFHEGHHQTTRDGKPFLFPRDGKEPSPTDEQRSALGL